MPLLNNVFNSNNSNNGTGWINPEVSTGIFEPFITSEYNSAFDGSMFGNNYGCVTSASLWTTDNQSSIEVMIKQYDSNNIKYFNGIEYDYNKNINTVVGNIIWYGGTNGETRGDTKRGFVLIAGLNNEISRYDIDTNTLTVEVAGDATLFNGSKGQVFCIPDIENNSLIFGAVYLNENFYPTIRSINTSKTNSWSDSSAVVDYDSYALSTRYFDGAPIYNNQTNKVHIISRAKTFSIDSSMGIVEIDFDPTTQKVINSESYSASIPDIFFNNIQITAINSMQYSFSPKTYNLISYVYNATVNKFKFSSQDLIWYRGYKGLDGVPSAIYAGDNYTLMYTYGCYKNTDNRTYQDGGMVVKLDSNKTYMSGDSPIFSTLRYYLYNDFFNNEDMIWINCKKNNVLYLQPVTNIFILTNGTDSLYSDMIDFKIVEVTNITSGKRYYEYKVEEDCMICCDKYKIYSVNNSDGNS